MIKDASEIKARPACQVQMAHDLLEVVLSQPPESGLSNEARVLLTAQRDALCWVLQHQTPGAAEFSQIMRMLMEGIEVIRTLRDLASNRPA